MGPIFGCMLQNVGENRPGYRKVEAPFEFALIFFCGQIFSISLQNDQHFDWCLCPKEASFAPAGKKNLIFFFKSHLDQYRFPPAIYGDVSDGGVGV